MAPSISIREYIRWLPEPASEPTLTIVVTSTKSRFVDIRLLKSDFQQQDPHAPHQLAEHDVLPFTSLDWAFGGTSRSELLPATDGGKVTHSTWTHWVDSRTTEPETVVDEADMLVSSDGAHALERGRMVNPATGIATDYEESWAELEPCVTEVATDSNEVGDGDGNEKGKHVCAVLVLHDDSHQARGMVVRVGQFCQGIMRVGEQVSLERWGWTKEGKWMRWARMGQLWLPCGAAMGDAENGRLVLGGEIKHGDLTWKCVELDMF